MISRAVKLYPTKVQAARLEEWFQIGTGIWNWALGQYMADGLEPVTYASLCRSTRGHATRIGFNSVAFQGVLKDVSRAWGDYRVGLRGKPKRKGQRNRLASIPFRQDVTTSARMVRIPSLGAVKVRGHRDVAGAKVVQCRLHRRARGWYCTLVLDAEAKRIPLVSDDAVGIDLGFSTLATLSTGEKIAHPREYERIARRIGQVDRGHNRRLLGRLHQRLGNARRHRHGEGCHSCLSRS